ncbi:MAG: hypothetical protein KatS3mg068_2097 [Candidatus Sericytochromatia bacterium]|nr:MAG: hypothetical protein KatS3mg068_2097 [Candidatus Sericytochromatia bacterium]
MEAGKVTKIVEITGMEGDIISTQDIFSFESKGIDENGKIIGNFVCTKIRPKVLDIFESRGVKIPSIFEPENIISRMKQKVIILGIDPGTATIGYGLIEVDNSAITVLKLWNNRNFYNI